MAEFLFNNDWVLVSIACVFFFAGALITMASMNHAWMIVGFIVATLTMFIDYIEPLKPKQNFTMSEMGSDFDIHETKIFDGSSLGYEEGITEYIVSHKGYDMRSKMSCNIINSECKRDTDSKIPSHVTTFAQYSDFLNEPKENDDDDYWWYLIFLLFIILIL